MTVARKKVERAASPRGRNDVHITVAIKVDGSQKIGPLEQMHVTDIFEEGIGELMPTYTSQSLGILGSK